MEEAKPNKRKKIKDKAIDDDIVKIETGGPHESEEPLRFDKEDRIDIPTSKSVSEDQSKKNAKRNNYNRKNIQMDSDED